jgi:hypothetical protein
LKEVERMASATQVSTFINMLAPIAQRQAKKHDNKIILAKQYASSLSIVEFPGHNHDDLFYDASLAPVYAEEMKKMLNGSANGTKSDPTGANT